MIRGLEKIKSEQEHELIRAELDYYIKELAWIRKSVNPAKDVETELAKLINVLRKDMDEEEERELLERIHSLKTKYSAIKEKRYENTLRQNITACLLLIEQYEAEKENRSLLDVLKGIFTNNKETMDYFQRKYMVSLSNAYGLTPSAVNLNLESIEEILEYIAKNYDLVGIQIVLDKTENQLTVADEKENPIKSKIVEITNNYISENINEETPELTEAEKEKIKIKRGKVSTKPLEMHKPRKNEEKDK
jgi:hypothetical protein